MPESRSATAEAAPTPGADLHVVLAGAVAALGGSEREGQVQMAEAVAAAMSDGHHLLVQAGTGTGKSLAYLVPSLLHRRRVVVATATLALQHQLVERDLPRLIEAVAGLPDARGLDTSYAVLKGRSNYACLHRIREGVPDEQGVLVDVASGSMAEQVLALRSWAETEAEDGGSGERDHAPRHTEREWRQVSVSHRDCLGAAKCPFGEECFVETARERAQRSHLIVTNHSLLAIDAVEGVPMIPDYDAVVIDEAHELATRVTQAATDELAVGDVERAARRSQRHVEGDQADELADAAEALRAAIEAARPGRFDPLPTELADALILVRDAARATISAYPKAESGPGGSGGPGGEGDAGLTQARGSVQEVFATAERMAAGSASDVAWLSEGGERIPPRLCVAPLEVWGQMRDKLLSDKTVVMTSATLMLGGDFGAVATGVGLKPTERLDVGPVGPVGPDRAGAPASRLGSADSAASAASADSGGSVGTVDGALPWVGLDVGSPFDYRRQAILYVAKHLPPPGRDGMSQAVLDEIVALVDAADGRTLGLFSSRRAAEAAAQEVRRRLPHLTTLAQGEAQLPELARQFTSDPHTSLFGTLSLWQGIDVPGATCQLVLIDRIPFPRPDDPLMSARQKAVDEAGGNGFMRVAASHAALLLAQGTGRLIRSTNDRGVVACLDPRLTTKRYGGFLTSSLPPMWTTTDPAVVRQALRRLAGG